jgi:TRAP-type transport system small permease protein
MTTASQGLAGRVFSRALETISALSLVALVLTMCADVVGRYGFGSPLMSAFSLVRLELALMVFAALPLATWDDEHLRAGLLDHLWKGQARAWQAIAVQAISALACTVLAWRLIIQGQEYQANREVLEVLQWPMYAVAYTLAAFSLMAAAAAFGLMVRKLQAMIGTP